MTDKGPPLQLLGGAYFDQDFELGSGGPAEILQTFARVEGWEAAQGASATIKALLRRSADEAELRRVWTKQCYAYYNPTYDGMTYREWFERMLTLLAPYTEPGAAQA